MNMLTKIGALIGLLLLVGCEASTKETTSEWVLPPELADCSTYRMTNGYKSFTIVKCPTSVVSTNELVGKATYTNVAVETRTTKQIEIDSLKEKIKQLENSK